MTLVCGDDTVQCLSMMESEIEIYQVDTQSVWMINKHITHNLYSHFIRSITVANNKQIKECNYIAYVLWKFRLPESLITADCVVFYTKVNYRHRLITLKCVLSIQYQHYTHQGLWGILQMSVSHMAPPPLTPLLFGSKTFTVPFQISSYLQYVNSGYIEMI